MPERRRQEPDSAPPQSRQVHDDLENILRNLFLAEVATPQESRSRLRDYAHLRGEDEARREARQVRSGDPNKGTPYPRVPYTSDVPSDRGNDGGFFGWPDGFGATRPYVEPPPGWGSSIDVGPGSDVAQMLRRLENVVPGIGGLVGDITIGPNSDYIEWVLNKNPKFLGYVRNPFPRATRRGSYSPSSHDIYIRPAQRESGLLGTLAHELLHKSESGSEDHTLPYIAGEIASMMYEPLSPEEIGNRVLRRSLDPSSLHPRKVALGLDELLSELSWYESQLQGPQ